MSSRAPLLCVFVCSLCETDVRLVCAVRYEIQASRDSFFREVDFTQTVLGSSGYAPDLNLMPLANPWEFRTVFAGMTPETWYNVRVRCFNVDSFGPWTLSFPTGIVVGRCVHACANGRAS